MIDRPWYIDMAPELMKPSAMQEGASELWITVVTKAPIPKPAIGLFCVFVKSRFRPLPDIFVKPPESILILTMKTATPTNRVMISLINAFIVKV